MGLLAAVHPARLTCTTLPRAVAKPVRPTRVVVLFGMSGLVALVALFCCSSSGAIFVESKSLAAPITASVNLLYLSTFDKAAVAYQLHDATFPRITMKLISGSAAGALAVENGLNDFSVSTSSYNNVARAAGTLGASTNSYPIMVSAYAVYYNIPELTTKLVLNMLTACQIWRGNITMWNDARILATNVGAMLPAKAIIVVMNSFANDGHTATSKLCTKVDPVWAATPGLGITALPTIAKFVPIPVSASSPGGASYMVDNPYTFGWNSMTVAPVVTAIKVASLINQAGKIVDPTPATIAQTFLELAQGTVTPGASYDLVNPQSAYAWPVCLNAWLLIDSATAQTTCASKKALFQYLLWMFDSPVVSALATSFGVVMLPELYLQQTGLLAKMRREMLCDGAALVPLDTTSAFAQGAPIMQTAMNLITTAYAQVDSTFQYAFTATTDRLALARISAGEIDMALVQPSSLSDNDIDVFTAAFDATTGISDTRGGILYPAYQAGVVIVFSMPLAISTLYATWSTGNTLGGLPALYPLKLDVPTIAAIFSGKVTSWTDARVTAFNPQLQAWFGCTNAPVLMSTVVCCSATSTDPMIASTILSRAIYADDEELSSFASPALMFASIKTDSPLANMSIVEAEGRMATKVITAPGSVSYRLISTATTDITTEFQVVHTNSLGKMEAVAPTPTNMMACATAAVGAGIGSAAFTSAMASKTRSWVNNAVGCYQLTTLISIAVSSAYSTSSTVTVGAASATSTDTASDSTDDCVRGKETLQMLAWMQTTPALSTAAGSIGQVRLGDLSPVSTYVVSSLLNSATCDGQTILITLPIIWSLATGVTTFGIIACILAMVLCAATCGGLWYWRHHPVIRSASPIFLAQIAIGLMFLSLGVMAWSFPVGEASCHIFAWFGNFGFTFAFAPLFAKTWRIYAIFSTKKIKLVKISNSKLIWLVVAMLAFEVVILSIWTAVSPLQPIMYERATTQADGAIRQLTHCSVDSQGMAFVGIEAAFKGLLLFFGSLMGFSTRKVVSTFNESAQIAWSIYNVVFSGLIVACIIVFIDTLGNTLVLLVLFLLLWVIYCTWSFIFVPKLSVILTGTDDKVDIVSGMKSSLGSANGANSFTFASTAHMPFPQLACYAKALETQLERVRKRLTAFSGSYRATGIGSDKGQTQGLLQQQKGSGEYEGRVLREPTSPSERPLNDKSGQQMSNLAHGRSFSDNAQQQSQQQQQRLTVTSVTAAPPSPSQLSVGSAKGRNPRTGSLGLKVNRTSTLAPSSALPSPSTTSSTPIGVDFDEQADSSVVVALGAFTGVSSAQGRLVPDSPESSGLDRSVNIGAAVDEDEVGADPTTTAISPKANTVVRISLASKPSSRAAPGAVLPSD